MSTVEMRVDYDDGTWAVIPSEPGEAKEYYLKAIKDYQPKPDNPVAIADHPMKIGDEGVVGEGYTVETEAPSEWDYGAARMFCYPTIQRQLEALYDTRKGSNTKQEAIDAHIEIVKAKFPVDSTIYTSTQIDAALTELKKDAKWTDD